MAKSTTPDIPKRREARLPQSCCRVLLPLPPNFLHGGHGETIPVADIEPGDAVLLGLAMARQFVDHHRERWIRKERLKPAEAEQLPGTTLAHDGIVDRIARDISPGWADESPAFRAARIAGVRDVITRYLEEIAK